MSGFIIYIIVSIFTPGPNNIYASFSSSKIGFKKTMPFMIGIFLGTTLIFVITAFLNIVLYTYMETAFRYVGIIGGLFIIYLSIVMATKHTKKTNLHQKEKQFMIAIMFNFINPKTIIFGITVATYYIEVGLSKSYIYMFTLLMGVLCYLAVIVWGLLGVYFSKILNKHSVIFNVSMALLLAYSGVVILVESIW